jgi:hypothetical protein
MDKTPNCCICGKKVEEKVDFVTGKMYWNQGENAMPLKDGRCCSFCNIKLVFPLRLKLIDEKRNNKCAKLQ